LGDDLEKRLADFLRHIGKANLEIINTSLINIDDYKADSDGNIEVALAGGKDQHHYRTGILQVERNGDHVLTAAIILDPPEYRIAPGYSGYRNDYTKDELAVLDEKGSFRAVHLDQIGYPIGEKVEGVNRTVKVNRDVFKRYQLAVSEELDRLEVAGFGFLRGVGYRLGLVKLSSSSGKPQNPTE